MNLRVGLTGGVASGKSALADELASLGAALVDTDSIAHALTAPGGAAIESLRSAFGDAAIGPDGARDRPAMRARVFGDDAARRRLEAILPPLIRAHAHDAVARASRSGAPYTVIAVPLLVESGGWRDRCDRVLVVDCTEATQIARACRRPGMDSALARAVLERQATRAQRLAAADDVVFNGGSLEDLAGHARRLDAHSRALAAQAAPAA
ncbi:MAG: dephospho-CoA kinase [Betaproteobacteria bacterium]